MERKESHLPDGGVICAEVPAAALSFLDASALIPSRPRVTPAPPASLRFLSYNIQTGIATSRYRHYLTQSWKHVLPYRERMNNLDRMARLLRSFDIVGLQEADAGSIRSGYVNQVAYLAEKALFPYWYHQTNRRLGRFAQHSLGFLSRIPPAEVTEHRLPGAIPGRGALVARLPAGAGDLFVVILHLALGKRSRLRQIEYIAGMVRGCRRVVLLGDLNFRAESRDMEELVRKTGLLRPPHGLRSFPSWKPRRNIDHIMVSPDLEMEKAKVLDWSLSDHLPVAAVVRLPRRAAGVKPVSVPTGR